MRFARINLIYFLVFLFGTAVVARLFFLQVINGELYKALAKGHQEIFQQISGERGDIFLYDKDKIVLAATNKESRFCHVAPKLVQDKERVAELLSSALSIDKDDLFKNMVANSERLFLLVKRNISEEERQQIQELGLDGVFLDQERQRLYPFGQLASDVLGFVNQSGEGQYGIEGYWNSALAGQEGWQKISYGPFGRLSDGDTIGSMKGVDLILTIDKNIQSQAEKILKDFSEKFGFKSGQIIVIDPVSGKVMALADFPGFNPNNFQEYAGNNQIELFQNKAIQTVYEPGSAFKAITMASALNEGKITPDTTYIDTGKVVIKDKTITNYDNRIWGESTMTQVLERSINTGAVFVQRQLSNQAFIDYLERFGVFEKTNIDLDGETYSENREFKKGWEVNYATASFGQGINMNLMQMARAFCVIANKGKFVQPYVVEAVMEAGIKKPFLLDKPPDQIISSNTAEDLTKMLIAVTESGYGKDASVAGYYVAGKTGTSQIPYSALGINKAGYSEETWQSFIGFAPAFNPKFVIAVKLDSPKTRTASESAVFVFQNLAKYILDYYQILPEKE
ncbi:penicillin-binding protein 2 [Patescibacteria group bacterium]|nr:penicillin-binding protein 2 [Patescibacteria group bacterium]MBU4162103.1 penicillin-binding protein 2 [Patescibacteria group bacterium]